MSALPSNPAPASTRQEDIELLPVRKSILQVVLVIASLVGTITYFSNIFVQISDQDWIFAIIQTIVYAIAVLITVLHRLPYNLRLYTLLAILFLLSISDLLEGGLVSEGRLFLTSFAVLAVLLLPFRAGMWAFFLSVLTLVAVAALMVTGIVPSPDPKAIDDSRSIYDWITGGLIYTMMTLLLVASIIQLLRRMGANAIEQKRLSRDLERERASLEERIQERTSVLEKQAALMEVSANFMQEVSRYTDQATLLDFTAAFFLDRFGIHNILIGVNDAKEEFCIPIKSSGDLAAAFHAQIQKIRLRQPGAIGDLIAKGSARLVINQNEEAVYFRFSGLEDLHSLVVIPLKVNEKQIGAILLFNSADRGTSNEEVQLYHTIAGQLAAALEKSRLLAEMQRNLEEFKASSQQQIQHSWRSYLRSARQPRNYRYDHNQVESEAARSDTAGLAVQQGRVIVAAQPGDDNGGKAITSVAIPIQLRDQSVGVVEIRFESGAVPKDMVTLVEATTKRLAIALENARLMEQVQNRAEREHIVSGIGSQIRSQNDIDSILKTAAIEIGRSLGVSEVLVQLRADKTA